MNGNMPATGELKQLVMLVFVQEESIIFAMGKFMNSSISASRQNKDFALFCCESYVCLGTGRPFRSFGDIVSFFYRLPWVLRIRDIVKKKKTSNHLKQIHKNQKGQWNNQKKWSLDSPPFEADVITYMRYGSFAASMTGNMVFAGREIALLQWEDLTRNDKTADLA